MAITQSPCESAKTLFSGGPYQIPKYQREYSWTKENIQDFLEDVENAYAQKKEYFLGQIVIHNDEQENIKYIIDGQQRIVTTTILFAVLRDAYKEIAENYDNADASSSSNHIQENFIGTSLFGGSYKIFLNDTDREFFQKFIQRVPSQKSGKLAPSHKLIIEAYDACSNFVSDLLEAQEGVKNKMKTLDEYALTVMDRLHFINVQTPDLEDAFIIFETLNARGKELETADLLKNYVLKKAKGDVDEVYTNWGRISYQLDGYDLTKYVRYYWNSRHQFARERNLFREIRSNINTSALAKDFVISLKNTAETFVKISKPLNGSGFSNKKLKNSLIGLADLGASSFYPICLAAIEKFSEDEIALIVNSIEVLVFRNITIKGETANKYEVLFAEVAKAISDEELTDAAEVIQKIQTETIDDEAFRQAFINNTKITTKNYVRYIFRKVNKHLDPEYTISRDNDEIHIEHIMPQAKGSWDIDDDLHDQYLERIGNKTLLGNEYNELLKNELFDVKKSMYSESTIKVTNQICTYETWGPDDIKNRQIYLAEIAVQVWKI